MKVIDLFAGVGGLSLGFEKNGFEVVFSNEIDKEISYTYKKNFPRTECLTEDITKLNYKKYLSKYRNKISVLIGGPPCQGLSQKGQRNFFEDKRNYLFKYFLEITEYINPEFILIENVPGLITAENGYFFKQISQTLNKFNYDIDAKILHANKFGVPQIRKRAFILCRKNKLNFKLNNTNNRETKLSDSIDDLPELKSGEGNLFVPYNKKPFSMYQKEMRLNSKGVWNHVATKHSKTAIYRMKYMKINGTRLDLPEDHRTKSIYSGTWSRLNPNGYAKTITTRFDTPSSGQFTLPHQNRCLTIVFS